MTNSVTGRMIGKVALVVGAGMGIGAASAEVLGAQGAKIIVADINREAVESTCKRLTEQDIPNLAVELDVADVDACASVIDQSVSEFGKLDVLVSSAAVTPRNAFSEEVDPVSLFDRVIDVNLKGSYFLAYHAVQSMKQHGSGSIVFLASIAGLVGYPKGMGAGFSPYVCSKGAIVQLSKNLAIEYASDGIRVNCVCPGYVETPMARAVSENPELRSIVDDLTPIGRMASAEEIANAILFLASDESSYMTGSNVVVDGGFTAK